MGEGLTEEGKEAARRRRRVERREREESVLSRGWDRLACNQSKTKNRRQRDRERPSSLQSPSLRFFFTITRKDSPENSHLALLHLPSTQPDPPLDTFSCPSPSSHRSSTRTRSELLPNLPVLPQLLQPSISHFRSLAPLRRSFVVEGGEVG